MTALKSQATIIENGETITVSIPYNPSMIGVLRARGGKWDKDNCRWILPALPENFSMLKANFNWVPRCGVSWVKIYNGARTRIQPGFSYAEDAGSYVYYRGYLLASRTSKNSRVAQPSGVAANGTYAPSGGSVKYPDVLEGSDVESWNLLMYDGIPDTTVTVTEGKSDSKPVDEASTAITSSANLGSFDVLDLIEELEKRGYTVHNGTSV